MHLFKLISLPSGLVYPLLFNASTKDNVASISVDRGTLAPAHLFERLPQNITVLISCEAGQEAMALQFFQDAVRRVNRPDLHVEITSLPPKYRPGVTARIVDDVAWFTQTKQVDPTHPPLELYIYPGMQPEDFFGSLMLTDKAQRKGHYDQDKINRFIDQFRTRETYIYHLESNPEMSAFFHSLLTGTPPSLYIYGKHYTVDAPKVTLVSEVDSSQGLSFKVDSKKIEEKLHSACLAKPLTLSPTLLKSAVNLICTLLQDKRYHAFKSSYQSFLFMTTLVNQLCVELAMDKMSSVRPIHMAKAFSNLCTKFMRETTEYDSLKSKCYRHFDLTYKPLSQPLKRLKDLMLRALHSSQGHGTHSVYQTIEKLLPDQLSKFNHTQWAQACDTHGIDPTLQECKDVMTYAAHPSQNSELAATAQWWRKTMKNAFKIQHHPIALVLGPTGIGKTHSMTEVAKRLNTPYFLEVMGPGIYPEDLLIYPVELKNTAGAIQSYQTDGVLIQYAKAVQRAKLEKKPPPFLVLDEATLYEKFEIIKALLLGKGIFADGQFYEVPHPRVFLLGNQGYQGRQSLQDLSMFSWQRWVRYDPDMVQALIVRPILTQEYDGKKLAPADVEKAKQLLSRTLDLTHTNLNLSYEVFGTRELRHCAVLGMRYFLQAPPSHPVTIQSALQAAVLQVLTHLLETPNVKASVYTYLSKIAGNSEDTLSQIIQIFNRQPTDALQQITTIHEDIHKSQRGFKRGGIVISRQTYSPAGYARLDLKELSSHTLSFEDVETAIKTAYQGNKKLFITNAHLLASHLWESIANDVLTKDSLQTKFSLILHSDVASSKWASHALHSRCILVNEGRLQLVVSVLNQYQGQISHPSEVSSPSVKPASVPPTSRPSVSQPTTQDLSSPVAPPSHPAPKFVPPVDRFDPEEGPPTGFDLSLSALPKEINLPKEIPHPIPDLASNPHAPTVAPVTETNPMPSSPLVRRTNRSRISLRLPRFLSRFRLFGRNPATAIPSVTSPNQTLLAPQKSPAPIQMPGLDSVLPYTVTLSTPYTLENTARTAAVYSDRHIRDGACTIHGLLQTQSLQLNPASYQQVHNIPDDGHHQRYTLPLKDLKQGKSYPLPTLSREQKFLDIPLNLMTVYFDPQTGVFVLIPKEDIVKITLTVLYIPPLNLCDVSPEGQRIVSAKRSDNDLLKRGFKPDEIGYLRSFISITFSFNETTPVFEKILAFTQFFRDFQSRRYELPKRLTPLDTLKRFLSEKVGVCRHLTQLFLLFCHVEGIEAQGVFNSTHIYPEIVLDGHFFSLDFSLNHPEESGMRTIIDTRTPSANKPLPIKSPSDLPPLTQPLQPTAQTPSQALNAPPSQKSVSTDYPHQFLYPADRAQFNSSAVQDLLTHFRFPDQSFSDFLTNQGIHKQKATHRRGKLVFDGNDLSNESKEVTKHTKSVILILPPAQLDTKFLLLKWFFAYIGVKVEVAGSDENADTFTRPPYEPAQLCVFSEPFLLALNSAISTHLDSVFANSTSPECMYLNRPLVDVYASAHDYSVTALQKINKQFALTSNKVNAELVLSQMGPTHFFNMVKYSDYRALFFTKRPPTVIPTDTLIEYVQRGEGHLFIQVNAKDGVIMEPMAIHLLRRYFDREDVADKAKIKSLLLSQPHLLQLKNSKNLTGLDYLIYFGNQQLTLGTGGYDEDFIQCLFTLNTPLTSLHAYQFITYLLTCDTVNETLLLNVLSSQTYNLAEVAKWCLGSSSLDTPHKQQLIRYLIQSEALNSFEIATHIITHVKRECAQGIPDTHTQDYLAWLKAILNLHPSIIKSTLTTYIHLPLASLFIEACHHSHTDMSQASQELEAYFMQIATVLSDTFDNSDFENSFLSYLKKCTPKFQETVLFRLEDLFFNRNFQFKARSPSDGSYNPGEILPKYAQLLQNPKLEFDLLYGRPGITDRYRITIIYKVPYYDPSSYWGKPPSGYIDRPRSVDLYPAHIPYKQRADLINRLFETGTDLLKVPRESSSIFERMLHRLERYQYDDLKNALNKKFLFFLKTTSTSQEVHVKKFQAWLRTQPTPAGRQNRRVHPMK